MDTWKSLTDQEIIDYFELNHSNSYELSGKEELLDLVRNIESILKNKNTLESKG